MGHAAHLAPAVDPDLAFRFESLVLTEPQSIVKARSATVTASLVVHALALAAVIILPLFFDQVLPPPDAAVRAFFVAPVEMPPPPPPPPPAAGVRALAKAPAAPRPTAELDRFTAPIEIPEEIPPEEAIDLGIEGGVPGGVEGGVPGGVAGGIVGGLPAEAPSAPPKVVRIGGRLVAPKLVHVVKPEFPQLALLARLSGIVILEAHVGVNGRVVDVRVLRGAPLLDAAAAEAVRQWRYQPLLLNGVPTEFVLAVTVNFSLATREAP